MNDNKYIFFYGGVFSQWYSCKFTVDGITYNCAEQFMMASKAKTFGDKYNYNRILSSYNPKVQKRAGRAVRNYDEKIWDKCRYDIVVQGNMAKFSQNDTLRQILLNTGDKILVEASPVDTIWGIGLGLNNPDIYDETKWKGKNLLGKALMEVREKLKDS